MIGSRYEQLNGALRTIDFSKSSSDNSNKEQLQRVRVPSSSTKEILLSK